MYKLKEDGKIKEYIENNLTEVEQGMFHFLINSIPETILEVDGEDNEPLLSLVIVLAKVVGNSRELILGLEDAHYLPALITDILNKHNLKKNKQKLLALKASDLGFDVDFNKLSEKDLDELTTYFNFLLNHYNIIKHRGSEAALHQVIKDYTEVRADLTYPKIKILKSKEEDNIADDTVGTGTIRVHFNPDDEEPLPADFADSGRSFKPLKGLYYMNPSQELYKLIMNVKPAGLIYELIVRATMYNLFSVESAMSKTGSGVLQYSNLSNGFLEHPEQLAILEKPNYILTFNDKITSIEDIKVDVDYQGNIKTDYNWKDKDPEENNLPNKLTKTTLELDYEELPEADEDTGRKKVDTYLEIKSSYDRTKNIKIEIEEELPEVVDKSKLVVEAEPTSAGNKDRLKITYENNLLSTPIEKITTTFKQSDFFEEDKSHSVNEENLVQPEELKVYIFSNPSKEDKAMHGTLNSNWFINRPTGSKTILRQIETLKIPDKQGRKDFEIIIDNLKIDNNFKVSFNVKNPNDFPLKLKIDFEWQYQQVPSQTWEKDNTANNGDKTITLQARELKEVSRSIHIDGDYPNTNRHRAKRINLTFEVLNDGSNTPNFYELSEYQLEAKDTDIITPEKIELAQFQIDKIKRDSINSLDDIIISLVKNNNQINIQYIKEKIGYIEVKAELDMKYEQEIALNSNVQLGLTESNIKVYDGNIQKVEFENHQINIDTFGGYSKKVKYTPKLIHNPFNIVYGAIPENTKVEVKNIVNLIPKGEVPPKYYGGQLGTRVTPSQLVDRAPYISIATPIIKFPVDIKNGDIIAHVAVTNNSNKVLKYKILAKHLFYEIEEDAEELISNNGKGYNIMPNSMLQWNRYNIKEYFNDNVHNIGSTIPGRVIIASIDINDLTKFAGFNEATYFKVEFSQYTKPNIAIEGNTDPTSPVYAYEVVNINPVPVELLEIDGINEPISHGILQPQEAKPFVEIKPGPNSSIEKAYRFTEPGVFYQSRGVDSEITQVSILGN